MKSKNNHIAFAGDKSMSHRVKIALSCRDCDSIRKVPGAGELLSEKGQTFQRMHNGVLVKKGIYHGDWMTDIIRGLQGHHEPQEEKVFQAVAKTLAPGATMVELGSFWAYYSMWFQHEIPNAVSIMVEPDSKKLQAGRDNFALNNMTGTFIHAFVGAKTTDKATFLDWDGSEVHLPQVSVDGLMQVHALKCIHILHADIQGAEHQMLKGAAKSLSKRRIKFLFISTHSCEHRRCLRLIRKHGYRVLAEHTVLESFSGDGLIVAASPDASLPEPISISKRGVTFGEWAHNEIVGLKQRWLAYVSGL